MMAAGANIQDRFFKETLSHVQVARDFLENYHASKVIGHLELRTPKISEDKEQHPDLLYKVESRIRR